MSEYGLEVRNNSNIVIIDSTYKNHTYYQHGSSSVVQYLNEIDIDDLSTSGLLFIKAPSGIYASPFGFKKNGSVYDKIVIAASGSGTVDWIVFKEGSDALETGYGLVVYDSSSEVVFNSNELGYCNVVNDTDVGSTISVLDAVNNYYEYVGGSWRYNYNGTTKYTTREIVGIKYNDSTHIDSSLFIYANVYGDHGIGNASGNGGRIPTKLIEIKPPPGI
jgi:hypothetical protein